MEIMQHTKQLMSQETKNIEIMKIKIAEICKMQWSQCSE
jgi:hypothetical protein